MRILSEELKPHLVIVGFSMATDLYDLVPPEKVVSFTEKIKVAPTLIWIRMGS